MSELRTVKLSEMNAIKLGLRNDKLYFKAEADKMITEKDKNIDLYKRGWEESDRINAHLYAELRHSNYKRCLAMAMWCGATALFYGKAVPKVLNMDISDHRRQKVFLRLRHYEKWHKRWLELAEKFKPNSTAQ